MSDSQNISQPSAVTQHGPFKVVLDTNVLFQHRQLVGPNIDLFQQFLWRTNSTLVIPEIVAEEAVNDYERQVAEKLEAVHSSIRKLNGFCVISSNASGPTITSTDATKVYASKLKERLKELKAETPGYEFVTPSELVSRTLHKRRPFKEEDKGFRDTLLWLTTLKRVVSKDMVTVLISNDAGFAQDEQLHPDLKQDLKDAGFSESSVILAKTLEDFNKTYAKQVLLIPKHVIDAIRKGTYQHFSLAHFCNQIGKELFGAVEAHVDAIVSEARVLVRDLESFEEPYSLRDIEFDGKPDAYEVYELDKERLFIKASGTGSAYVDGMMFKSEYYCLPDNTRVEVEDEDWNNTYAWVAAWIAIEVTLNIVLNTTSRQVDSWEVESVSCWESDS